jgi:hypothetical protein
MIANGEPTDDIDLEIARRKGRIAGKEEAKAALAAGNPISGIIPAEEAQLETDRRTREAARDAGNDAEVKRLSKKIFEEDGKIEGKRQAQAIIGEVSLLQQPSQGVIAFLDPSGIEVFKATFNICLATPDAIFTVVGADGQPVGAALPLPPTTKPSDREQRPARQQYRG